MLCSKIQDTLMCTCMPGVVKMYPKFRRGFPTYEEDTIYSKEGREKRVDDGQIQGWEEGFMQGVEEGFDEFFDESLDEDFEEIM
jgi:hypothetical protein